MREDRRQTGGGDTHEDLHVQLSLQSSSLAQLEPWVRWATLPAEEGSADGPSWVRVWGGRFCTNCRPPSTGNCERAQAVVRAQAEV